MDHLKIDRAILRQIAAGKFIEMNKTDHAENRSHFVEGSLYAFDLIKQLTRDSKRGNSDDNHKGSENRISETEL